MSAEYFVESAAGRTPQEAFEKAVREAQYRWGHEGYTGTIAEKYHLLDEKGKQCFIMFPTAPTKEKAFETADRHSENPELTKWGPVLCIPTLENKQGETIYVFAGWASS